jgi:hypothetical protein
MAGIIKDHFGVMAKHKPNSMTPFLIEALPGAIYIPWPIADLDFFIEKKFNWTPYDVFHTSSAL